MKPSSFVFSALACALTTACSAPAVTPVSSPPQTPATVVVKPVELTSAALDLSPVAKAVPKSPLPRDWAQEAVFIEIYVRGYKDSNGDGIGDFKGLTQQLDYLAKLGVQGIWLMPVNQSQDHDHGYAVTDYRKLEPDYGTEADFKAFLAAAHARGIGVIMDYVINHSAYQNPLFLDSKNKLNDKRDWYVWKDHDPGWTNWDGSGSWHRIRPTHDYYYGVFWEQMPDFNLKNPKVLAYHQDNLRYWMNAGVDGFRFDAVGQLVENGKNAYESQPENKVILHDLQTLVTHDYPGNYMVCEEPADPVGAAGSDSCGSSFAFGFNEAVRGSVMAGTVTRDLKIKLQEYPLASMGLVLGSHDSYAGERLIEAFHGDEGAYKVAAATQLTLPGQPFIYYGEEMGMGHSKGNGGDWGLRAPMSWTAHGGFSTATPFRAPAENVAQYNAAAQQASPDSLWNFYRQLIATRKAHSALRTGDLTVLSSDRVLAYQRHDAKETILVAINYDSAPSQVSLAVAKQPVSLTPLAGFGSHRETTDAQGNITLQLAPREVRLYQLQK
jgi:alpha-amylase